MCDYCGCRENTVIERFMAEHEAFINLTGGIRRAIAEGDHDQVVRLADEVATTFGPHAEDEESGIFAEMRQREEYVEKLDNLCAEHGTLDSLLASIRAGEYDAFPAFEKLLRNHIDAEDNGVFPAANIALDGEAWDRVDATLHEAQHRRGEAHSH